MFKLHVRPTVILKQLKCYDYNIFKVSYKMTPRSEKITEQGSITSFILSAAWTTSTGVDRGRGPPSFLPLARTSLLDSTQLLDHLWQWMESMSRLMAATQQVEEKMTWGMFNKKGLMWFDLQKAVVIIYAKNCWLILSYKLFSSKHDIEPATESIAAAWPKKTD
jgi:hypothetical protein